MLTIEHDQKIYNDERYNGTWQKICLQFIIFYNDKPEYWVWPNHDNDKHSAISSDIKLSHSSWF